MTGFVIVAALLLAGALLFVLPPLLARRAAPGSGVDGAAASAVVLREHRAELDQALSVGTIDAATHAAARAEIERRVLEDGQHGAAAQVDAGTARTPGAAIALGATVAALAIGLYIVLGTPGGLDPDAGKPPSPEHALTRDQVQGMVERLAARLQAQPDDTDGWIMLARSQTALGRYTEAVEAYARATAQRPNDAPLFADYADVLAMARGRKLAGDPELLALRALAIDPRHPKALALAGSAAFERGDYPVAIARWQTLLGLLPQGSDMARSIQGSIADAQRRGALAGDGRGTAVPAPAAAAIDGEIALAPEFAGSLTGTETVFVIARPVDGGRVPVAVLKRPVGAWPMAFRLDDNASMNPSQPLSRAASVVVHVRISRSGTPGAQSGDLEGVSDPVAPGSTGVRVRVTRRLP